RDTPAPTAQQNPRAKPTPRDSETSVLDAIGHNTFAPQPADYGLDADDPYEQGNPILKFLKQFETWGDTLGNKRWIGVLDTEFIPDDRGNVVTEMLATEDTHIGTVVREMACLFYEREEKCWERRHYYFYGVYKPPGSKFCENTGVPYWEEKSWYETIIKEGDGDQILKKDLSFFSELQTLMKDKTNDGGLLVFYKGGPEGNWIDSIITKNGLRNIKCIDSGKNGVAKASILREIYKAETWYSKIGNCNAHCDPKKAAWVPKRYKGGQEVHCAMEEIRLYAIAIFDIIFKNFEELQNACKTAKVLSIAKYNERRRSKQIKPTSSTLPTVPSLPSSSNASGSSSSSSNASGSSSSSRN